MSMRQLNNLSNVYLEAVYGKSPEQVEAERRKKDDLAGAPLIVTNADKKANTKAYQNLKKGVKGYKAADHMKEEEKKAKKDYDGDGKIESGKDEYFGSKDKAIKKAMGKKVKEGYQRNPEADPRSERQKRMDDPDTGINSAKFRAFMAAQQGGSKKVKKESLSNWRDDLSDLIEVVDNVDSDKEDAVYGSEKQVTEKKGIKNTVKINPNVKIEQAEVGESYEATKTKEVMSALKKRDLKKDVKKKIAADIVKRKGDTGKSDDRYAYEGYQRDPEQSKKDRTHSKQPDPSKGGFTGIGNMSIKDIMKMNAKIKAKEAAKKGVKEEVGGEKKKLIDPKLIRANQIKKQVLLKKMQAVRAGAGADIVASHTPEGDQLDERLGGKGYSRKATGGGGDWEDSDRGAGNKAKKRAGGKVEKKSPTYRAYVLNKEHHQKDAEGKVIEHGDGTPSSVEEAKVDTGTPEEKEKARNVRKFGVSHNVAGHGKLRRALHRSNRGDKKKKGDKSQYVEMEASMPNVSSKDKKVINSRAKGLFKKDLKGTVQGVNEGKKKGLDGKACWKGYRLSGTKKKGGKTVDNCVKEEDKAFEYVKKQIAAKYGKSGYVSKDNPRKPQSAADKAKARAHQAKVDAENAAERKKDPSQGRYPKG